MTSETMSATRRSRRPIRGLCMCIRHSCAPTAATSSAISEARRAAWLRHLPAWRPRPAPRSATSAFIVSTEICAWTPAATSASITGTTRRDSSSASTGSAPGRVDSPPTSRIDAPSASSASPLLEQRQPLGRSSGPASARTNQGVHDHDAHNVVTKSRFGGRFKVNIAKHGRHRTVPMSEQGNLTRRQLLARGGAAAAGVAAAGTYTSLPAWARDLREQRGRCIAKARIAAVPASAGRAPDARSRADRARRRADDGEPLVRQPARHGSAPGRRAHHGGRADRQAREGRELQPQQHRAVRDQEPAGHGSARQLALPGTIR